MLSRYILFFSLAFLLSSCSNKPHPVEETPTFNQHEMLTSIYHDNWITGVNDLVLAADELAQSAASFHSTPTQSAYSDVVQKWTTTILAFKKIEAFNFGPIKSNYLYNRIDSWPVSENLINNLLLDTFSINSDKIATLGSSSKGITAISYMLFATINGTAGLETFTSNSNHARNLDLVLALAQNVQQEAAYLKSVVAAYQPAFIDNITNDFQGSINQMVNTQLGILENIQKTRLEKALHLSSGLQLDSAFFESPHHDINLQLIHHAILGVQSTFLNKGLYANIDFNAAATENNTLTTQLESAFQKCLTLSNGTASFASFAQQPDNVLALNNSLKELFVLIKTDVVSILNIRLSISDNDGD